jgi:hypothetical protein
MSEKLVEELKSLETKPYRKPVLSNIRQRLNALIEGPLSEMGLLESFNSAWYKIEPDLKRFLPNENHAKIQLDLAESFVKGDFMDKQAQLSEMIQSAEFNAMESQMLARQNLQNRQMIQNIALGGLGIVGAGLAGLIVGNILAGKKHVFDTTSEEQQLG